MWQRGASLVPMFNTEDFPSSFLSRGLKFKVVGWPKPSEQKNSCATEKFSLGIGFARVPFTLRPAACASYNDFLLAWPQKKISYNDFLK